MSTPCIGRLAAGLLVLWLSACGSTEEVGPPPPPIQPELACVHSTVDELCDMIARRYPDKRCSLLVEPVTNRSERQLDGPALDELIAARIRERNNVDLIPLPPAGSPTPQVDLIAKVAINDEPVDSEPGTTVFKLVILLGQGGTNIYEGMCNGRWKEVLPPPE